MNQIELPQGTLSYRDEGTGPAIVFVHGFLVDHRLWDGVVDHLAARGGVRCIAPDLPLGSHRQPMRPDADLSVHGVARLVAAFLEALDLRDVTLVGNDSGGVISQLVCADHPERIGRLVLTNCDALEVFPPKGFEYLAWMPRIPGLMWLMLRSMLLVPRLRRLRMAYGALTRAPIPPALTRAWVEPAAKSRGIRRDAKKLLRSASRQITLDVAERLADFHRPATFLWGDADRFFRIELAERLAAKMPNATVSPVAGGLTFSMLDRPDEIADRIAELTSATSGRRSTSLRAAR